MSFLWQYFLVAEIRRQKEEDEMTRAEDLVYEIVRAQKDGTKAVLMGNSEKASKLQALIHTLIVELAKEEI